MKVRLSNLDYKFTVNSFDSALLFLKKELGWKKEPYYKRLNKSKSLKRNELSDSILKSIKEMNWLDKTLYNEVVAEEKKSYRM